MWQDNLRGEQGTKCPLCPSLPPSDSVGTGWAQGGCWVLGARVWRWVARMPSKAARLGELLCPGRGSLAALCVVVGFGRARQPGLYEEGTCLGTPLELGAPLQAAATPDPLLHKPVARSTTQPVVLVLLRTQPRNSIPSCGSLSLKYPLSQALAYLQSSPA